MQPTREELQAQLDELSAANAVLTRELEQARPARRKRGGWAWAVLSAALISIGVLLTPVGVVSTWAQQELTDTAYFVDTFAPLADEPAVQDFIVAEVVTAIDSTLNVDQLVDDLFAGLEGLAINPRAKDALDLLKAPAVSGVDGLILQTVTGFVQSDSFSQIWREALTVTHTQFLKTANGQADAAITIGQDQTISLQLGPIIQAVKEHLVADGFALADRIPEISRSITIAESGSIGNYVALYHLFVAVALWLPWVTLILLAAGVLVARRRALALVWAAGALLVTMVLLGSGIAIGKNVFALAVSSAIPGDAAISLYSGSLGFVSNMVLVVGVLAATVLIVTLFAGPWRWAIALRGYAAAGFASARGQAERHGITTGSVGEWLYRWRVSLRVLVAVACSAFLALNRPLTPEVIVWTAVIGVGAVAVLELASRPSVAVKEIT